MGFLGDLGVKEGMFGNFSGSGILFWVGIVFLFFFILVVVGIITFFVMLRKSRKNVYKNQIPIFMEINGKPHRIGLDWAKELFVPDSNISLFFLKSYKIYIARPTRSMGKFEYWYNISKNAEWVNFDLSIDPEQNTLANANYDHRDTRYAYTNLKEIIKKNYKDKSLVWWKDPMVMNIISFVIISIIFSGLIWLIVARTGGLIEKVGVLIEKLGPIADKMAGAVANAQNINSGVVPA